jgi:cell division protein FtsB
MLTQQIDKLQSDLDTVRAERLHIEHRVNLLRSESLDLDILDEQARAILGFAGDGEEVYFKGKKVEVE